MSGSGIRLHLAPDSTPPRSFYRLDALPVAQPTVSEHWRQKCMLYNSEKSVLFLNVMLMLL